MYCTRNFKTKKALKEAVAAGDEVRIFQTPEVAYDYRGTAYLVGPHYPQPHTWYAKVILEDGKVIKVK